jgi:hypothetical protein
METTLGYTVSVADLTKLGSVSRARLHALVAPWERQIGRPETDYVLDTEYREYYIVCRLAGCRL